MQDGIVRARRPKYLFSKLTKCGVCGGGFTLSSRDTLRGQDIRRVDTAVAEREAAERDVARDAGETIEVETRLTGAPPP